MKSKVWNYFDIAAKLAVKRRDDRCFYLAAMARRKDQALVVSANGAPWNEPAKSSHAEFKLSKKLDYYSTVYIVRVKIGTMEYGMSRPCSSCMQALQSKKVKKIYYTIDPETFGCISFDYNVIIDEKIYGIS